MRFFHSKSIAAKLLFVTGCCIALVLALSNVFLISATRDRVQTLTMEQAGAKAEGIAAAVAGDVGALASAARTMAGVLGRGHQEASFDRKGLINILKANLEQHAFAFGSWFCEEIKAWDGRQDDLLANTELGANDKGVLTPYWSKTKDGGIQFSTFKNDYAAEWYALAAKSGKGAITAPYLAEGTDVPTAMSSLAFPVMSKGKMIGVSGVDISLAMLSDKLKAMKPFGTGRVLLVAQGGQWLVAPDNALMMKPYGEAGADKVTAALGSGSGTVLTGLEAEGLGAFNRLVFPFDVPGVNARWVVLVDIPLSAISAPVEQQTWLMVIGGFVVLAAVMAALFFATRAFVQRPLRGLLGSIDSLSRGHYDKPVEGGRRGDEIGLVAHALEDFRHRLAGARNLEAEAASQRSQAESERHRSEAERNEAAALQQRIVAVVGAGLAALSRGELTHRIDADFPGDYAKLKEDFNAAVASLAETMLAVRTASDQIGSGTTEISNSALDLSRRTEQQAANLEETAAALNELTEQVHSSAENADRAAVTVDNACRDAERSGEVVRKAVSSMEGIAQSSHEISRIIGVIDEIAFQTNLLALNAGVEAARAGEAGKGFAVVAQEVRELAQRSANAAREIKSLINASGAQVQNGVQLVDQAGDALKAIADQVMQINGLIRQISASASEQAAGLKEVNAAVNQMDQVTQQNAAMVEETTAASRLLDGEAAGLKQLIARFAIGHAGNSAARPAQAPAPVRSAPPARSTRPVAAKGGRAAAVAATAPAAAEDWQEF